MNRSRTHRMWTALAPGMAAAALAGLLAGCGHGARQADDRELQYGPIRRALEREGRGDREGAIRSYREILNRHPSIGRAHLGLAFLLDGTEGDPVEAVYHYQRYLELRPGTEKREMIENRIRMARIALGASVVRSGQAAPERVAALEREIGQLKVQNANLTAQLQRARELNALLKARGSAPASAAAAPRAAAEPPAPAAAAIAPAVRTYRVAAGDTLLRIADRMYNDANRWKDIYEANRGVLRRPDDVRAGQELIIP